MIRATASDGSTFEVDGPDYECEAAHFERWIEHVEKSEKTTSAACAVLPCPCCEHAAAENQRLREALEGLRNQTGAE